VRRLLERRGWPRLLGLVLGLVFVWASLDKIWNPAEFARIVYRYHIVGPNHLIGPTLANLVAVTLPWVELILGLLLIAGIWRREAALLTGALLLSFVLGVASTMVRGIDVENCGCFTVDARGGRAAGWGLIVGDLGLLAIAAALVRHRPTHQAGAPAPEASS
jgi:hypothetical protein